MAGNRVGFRFRLNEIYRAVSSSAPGNWTKELLFSVNARKELQFLVASLVKS